MTVTRVVVCAVFTAVVCLAGSASAARRDGPPNLVFIMADDLGATDLACAGSGYYETPHVDRLAADGMRLLAHHHCPNCTPTRAALLTGQHPARTGIYTVGSRDRFDWKSRPLEPVENVTTLPERLRTVADQLRGAGYATGLFGKWHLGTAARHHPSRRGFDEAIVTMGKHVDFETDPPVPHPRGQYLAEFLTDRAVDFMRRHRDRPFFLYLPHFDVHAPHEADPRRVARFSDKPAAGGHHDPTYAAMIAAVDDSVGRIRATLDDLGLADDTVVIFTSDNGGVGGYAREGIKTAHEVTDNAPLRAGKGTLYEGGTRVPFIVHWPEVTRAGSSTTVPTIHVDVLPTLVEIAAAERPAQRLDGTSLVPLLRDPDATLDRAAIFQHFPGYLGAGEGSWRTTPVSVIQAGQWKLLEFLEDHRLELYDLAADPGERRNLADDEAERAAALRGQLAAWRREIGAPMPKPRRQRAESR